MNCETIDSIIDDHLIGRLTPAERQRAAEHASGCARCSAAWAVNDALRGEVVADPAPELFGALLRRVAGAPVQREAASRSRRLWPAAAAAAFAAVAIAALLPFVAPESMNVLSMRIVRHVPLSIRFVREVSAPPAVSADASASLAASPFVAGRDYLVLPGAPARAATAESGQIEVTEFFMFPCFPCYSFEPDLDRWEAQAPRDVSLTRVPAMFKPEAQLQARAYYAAEVLGKLDAMQDAFYGEIHERGNALASRAALADFFQRFGVDNSTFDATFDSSEVDARVWRAVALNREYGIVATPTLVVAGRYSTSPERQSDATERESPWPTMLAIVDELVAQARKCQEVCAGAARER